MKRLVSSISQSGFKRLAVIILWLTGAFMHSFGQINADQVVNIGRNALYFEDYVVAIQHFNQAIATKSYLAKPYFYRAIAKLNLEDFGGAEQDASKALELNEFITDAWEVRGVARQNQGNNEGAISDYEHALALVPRNRQLMFNMAMALNGDEQYARADSMFTRIIEYYPGFEGAYLGRARTYLATADTLRALADIDTALVRNPDSFNGHVMRAELLMNRDRPVLRSALSSMDKAIRLEPRIAGLYINRAYIRYNLLDWYGAMDDYDYALSLEPLNSMALFNRAMLNAETHAYDKAYEDLSAVLELEPDNYRARYNRSLVLAEKQDFSRAISDITAVIKKYPDFPNAYYLRSEFYNNIGDMVKAAKDFERAMAATQRMKPDQESIFDAPKPQQPDEKQLTEREFAGLLTVRDNTDLRQEYNNSAIRGNIQDRNLTVDVEAPVELSYYSSPTEVSERTFFVKELDDINRTRQLRFVVMATINPPLLRDEDVINRHFNSIEYYNSYMASHTPRAIDYIGRAMDFVTVHDYHSAIRDLDRAIALNPDFAPAYMLRAQARMRLASVGAVTTAETSLATGKAPEMDAMTRAGLIRKNHEDILTDLNNAIRLAPNIPYLYYNKGIELIEQGNNAEALDAFNRAIELKPDFGEAYYNRGYVELKSGNRGDGIRDLSRAGELGVVSAYNLIKRMRQ